MDSPSTSVLSEGSTESQSMLHSVAKALIEQKKQKTERPYDFFSRVVNEFPEDIMEPTEMLRYLQKKIVSGRPLES